MINLVTIFKKEGWLKCRPSFFYALPSIILAAMMLLTGCEKTETTKIQIYEGPIQEAENVDMLHTEKERITVKVKAKKVSEFQNGDQDFPEGIFIEFLGEDGKVTSTLSANSAFFYKSENKWKGLGKVEVKNLQKDEQLNSEELFWFPAKKNINTDKFVTIRTGKEVIYGTGLDAKQDMSEYRILKPEGEFAIEE